ncbi:unnamed protein product [Clavelina lepadiformis]|uniref:Uncharacterized protein n=1 Tax=Clavelina lepadiformis TaxID=159417 RepID=A0ABP0FK23_CLALP
MAYGRGSNLEPLAPSAVSKDASYEVATASNDNLTDLNEHQIEVFEKGKLRGQEKTKEPMVGEQRPGKCFDNDEEVQAVILGSRSRQ